MVNWDSMAFSFLRFSSSASAFLSRLRASFMSTGNKSMWPAWSCNGASLAVLRNFRTLASLSSCSGRAVTDLAMRMSRSVSSSPASFLLFLICPRSSACPERLDSDVLLACLSGKGGGVRPRRMAARRSASSSCMRCSSAASRAAAAASSALTRAMLSELYTFHDFLPSRCLQSLVTPRARVGRGEPLTEAW